MCWQANTGVLTTVGIPIEKLSFVEKDRVSSTRYFRSRSISTDIGITVFPIDPKVLRRHSRSSPKRWRSDRKLQNRKRWDEEFSESNAHRLARLKPKRKDRTELSHAYHQQREALPVRDSRVVESAKGIFRRLEGLRRNGGTAGKRQKRA